MGHSTRLESDILSRIASSGRRGWRAMLEASDAGRREERPAITFRDYMAMCLYDEKGGYYRTGSVRVGRSGDFYTSSAIGTIMGDKLAGYVASLAEEQERPVTIVEWGAGTGALAQQMLAAWDKSGSAWKAAAEYGLVDSNPVHLEEARNRLRDRGIEGWPAISFMAPEEAEEFLRGTGEERFIVVVANELLDAFPVHRVVKRNGILLELGVAEAREAEGPPFGYVDMPLSDERLEDALLRDGISLREGQIAEVNLAAEAWIGKLSGLVRQGCLVLIDYGHEAQELAAPHRMRGTLLCYKDHIARDEPFLDPGSQDITAHVNFTACMAAGAATGWELRYYGTQKQFLVDQGLLSDFTPHDGMDPFSEAARHNRAIRQLLLSDAMSETFKVLVLRK